MLKTGFWSKLFFLFFLALWFPNCLGLSEITPSSPPSENIPPSQPIPPPVMGGPDDPFPMPETILYVYGTGQRIGDTLEIEGQTRRLSDDQPVATKLLLRRKDDPNQFVFTNSNEAGEFTAQLPANVEQIINVVEVVTVNEANEPTSEIIEVHIADVVGYWKVNIELGLDSSVEGCWEQIPDFAKIFETQYLPVFYQEKTPVLSIFYQKDPFFMDGVFHDLKFLNETTVQAKGEYGLQEEFGFQYEAGCYEKNNYQLEGSYLDFEYTPEGRFISFSGHFQSRLTGEFCQTDCHLSGNWTAKSFMSWAEISENDPKSPKAGPPIIAPSQKWFFKKTLLTNFSMSESSPSQFLNLKKVGPKTLLAQNYKEIYRIDWIGEDQVEVIKIFSLPQTPNPEPNDLNQVVFCPPTEAFLNDLVILDQNWAVVSFSGICQNRAGFLKIPIQQVSELDELTKVFLPKKYSVLQSPVVNENRLYVIGTQFKFGPFWHQHLPENLEADLLEYSFLPGENLPVLKTYSLPEMTNPSTLLWIGEELWVFDAAFRDLHSFNESGGFIQIYQWQNNALKFKTNLIPYFSWRMGSGIQLRNLGSKDAIVMEPSENYLIMTGEGYLAWMDLNANWEENLPAIFEQVPASLDPIAANLSWSPIHFSHEFTIGDHPKILSVPGYLLISDGYLDAKLLGLNQVASENLKDVWQGPGLYREYLPEEVPHSIFSIGQRIFMIYKSVITGEGQLFEIKIGPGLELVNN